MKQAVNEMADYNSQGTCRRKEYQFVAGHKKVLKNPRNRDFLCETAETGKEKLVLMGIQPTYPSEKYGYIKPQEDGTWKFTEKPTSKKAEEYISAGALWNGGAFAYKIS